MHALLLIAALLGATTSITGTTAIEDTFLYEAAPTTNLDDFGVTRVGWTSSAEYSAIYRYDETQIPDGEITGHRYYLYQSTQSNSSGTLNVYRIDPSAPWVEAEATWEVYSTGNAWPGGSNGCTVSGTDFVASPSDSYAYADVGSTTLMNWDLPIAWATNWRDSGYNNEGFVAVESTPSGAQHLFYAFDMEDAPGTESYVEIDTLTVALQPQMMFE